MQGCWREVARIFCELRERVREGGFDQQRINVRRLVDEVPEIFGLRRVGAKCNSRSAVCDYHADGWDDMVDVDSDDLQMRDLELNARLERHILHDRTALVAQLGEARID